MHLVYQYDQCIEIKPQKLQGKLVESVYGSSLVKANDEKQYFIKKRVRIPLLPVGATPKNSGEEMSEGEEPEEEERENSNELRNVVVDNTEETDEEPEESEDEEVEKSNKVECCYFTQEKEESRKHDLRSPTYSKMKDQIWIKKDFTFLNGKKNHWCLSSLS